MLTLDSLLNNPYTVLFLGAGASADCGLPLGNQASEIGLEVMFQQIDKPDIWNSLNRPTSNKDILRPPWPRFEVFLETLASHLPNATKEVLRLFREGTDSPVHDFLVGRFNLPTLWLTTNFDDQIERALVRNKLPFRIFNSRIEMEQQVAVTRDEHMVIKLHGDDTARDLESDLGATINQILRSFPETAANAILKVASNRPLLILGYGARDPDLMSLLRSLISGASGLAWVDAHKPEEHVSKLCSLNPNFRYHEEGAVHAFQNCGYEVEDLGGVETAKRWCEAFAHWAANQPADCLVEVLANICVARGDKASDKAVAELHSLLPPEPLHRYGVLHREAEILLRQSEIPPDVSAEYVRELKTFGEDNTKAPALRTKSLLVAAEVEHHVGNEQEAITLARAALALAREISDLELRITTLTSLGLYGAFVGSDNVDDSLKALEEASALAYEHGFPVLGIDCETYLGIALMRHDCAGEAEAILRSVEVRAREVGDTRQQLVVAQNLAEALRYQGKFNDAIELNTRVLAMTGCKDDPEMQYAVEGNLGLCYAGAGRPKEAEAYFRTCLEMARHHHGGEPLCNAIYNFGWLRVLLSAWDDAIPYLVDSTITYAQHGSPEGVGGAMALQAWCLFRLGRVDEAFALVKEIRDKSVVPKGRYHADYVMINFALEHKDKDVSSLLSTVLRVFSSNHEQRFYLLMWMLQSQMAANDTPVLKQTFDACCEAASRSNQKLYFSVLEDHIDRSEVVVEQQLRDRVKKESPGKRREFLKILKAGL